MENQTSSLTARAASWTPPDAPSAESLGDPREGRYRGLKSYDGYELLGSYGVEPKPVYTVGFDQDGVSYDGSAVILAQNDSEALIHLDTDPAGFNRTVPIDALVEYLGTEFEYNSVIARQGSYANAYPLRDLPRIFGLEPEAFSRILHEMLAFCVEKYGQQDADGTTWINHQPSGRDHNVNYDERIHIAVAVGRNQYLVLAGLFEPRQTEKNAQWTAGQWMMRLAKKVRIHNPKPELIERGGVKLILDVQPAAVRTRLLGLKLRKAVNTAPMATPGAVSAAAAAMDLD